MADKGRLRKHPELKRLHQTGKAAWVRTEGDLLAQGHTLQTWSRLDTTRAHPVLLAETLGLSGETW